MHFFSSSTLAALSSFSALAAALPLASQNGSAPAALDRRSASYSVVQVDGGTTSSTPSTKTELRTITHSASASSVTEVVTLTEQATPLPPTTQTVVSTILSTQSGAPTTILVTTTITGSSTATPSSSSAVTGSSSLPSESPAIISTLAPVPDFTQTSSPAWPTSWNTSSPVATPSCNETLPTATLAQRAALDTAPTDLPKLPSVTPKAGSFNATRVPGAVGVRDLPSGANPAAAFPTGFYRRQVAAPTGVADSWNQTEDGVHVRTLASETAPAAPSGFVTRRAVAAATGTAPVWNSTVEERAVPFEAPVAASASGHAPERRAVIQSTGVSSAWNATSASLEGRALPSERAAAPFATGFLSRRIVAAPTGAVGAWNASSTSA